MKKTSIIVCLFIAGITANAQFYLGGSTGLEIKNTSYANGNPSSSIFIMEVYPELGYFLNKRWSVGGELGFGITNYSNSDKTDFNLRFNPYVRYSIIQAGKFEIIGKGSINPEFRSNYSYFGIHIDPILAYNLNDRIILQATLKFLTFRTYFEEYRDKDSSFGFKVGMDANNLANLGSLTVGFLYKF